MPSRVARTDADTRLFARVADSTIFRYLVLGGQLALVLWLIRWYKLEGQVFEKLAVLIWAGFTVNYFLPARARLPFFGLLSVFGIVAIFGPAQGAWLLTLGLTLIALCHVPLPFGARVAIVLGAGILLAVLRSGRLAAPWSAAIWPVFGSMFALRLVIYLYDLKHRGAPFSFWRSLAYFFMLPNAVFLLFPVVDYQTFSRTHDAEKDRTRVFQRGIDWMVRGAVHLVLYRLIYQNLPIDASSVVDMPQLLRYLIWPFLLYLNVSGLFHLTVGMLLLFGFNLPETHHLFYLASSFTDFWRRINIYWKDFMMKVFYYPAFFRLRRRGNNLALVVGTFVVFFATWFLHSWQFFWLRGSFLFKWNDILFWTSLAVLVAGAVLLEANRPMARRLATGEKPWGESVRKAFGALGVFVAITLLWSMWSSDSVTDWASAFAVVRQADSGDLWLLPVVLGLAAVFLLAALYFERRQQKPLGFYRQVARSGAMLLVLLLAGSYRVQSHLDKDMSVVLARLHSPGLNPRDAAKRQRGYYEKLNDVGWENPELAKIYVVRPPDWDPLQYRPDLAKTNEGLPYLELLPGAQGRFTSVAVRFNGQGMRDREYSRQPEPRTYRIALVGPSDAFATGVAQEEGYEALVEERLNREGGLGSYERVEILNFATPGYTALDVLAVAERKVFALQPHALLYVVHVTDGQGVVSRLAQLMHTQAPVAYGGLMQFAREARVDPGAEENTAARAFTPRREAILSWAYRELFERCRSRSVVPLMAYVPLLGPRDFDLPVPTLLGIARGAGFLTLDLSGVYGGRDPEKLQIAAWDDHPNAAGHRLVADRLHAAIRTVEGSLWRRDEHRADQGTGARLHSQGVPPGGGS